MGPLNNAFDSGVFSDVLAFRGRGHQLLASSDHIQFRAHTDEFEISSGWEFNTWRRFESLIGTPFDPAGLHEELRSAGFCEINDQSEFVQKANNNTATDHIFGFLSIWVNVTKAIIPW